MHLYSGQEAVSTGVIRQLRKSDYICSTYRDHVHALSKGVVRLAITTPNSGVFVQLCWPLPGMHLHVAFDSPTTGLGPQDTPVWNATQSQRSNNILRTLTWSQSIRTVHPVLQPARGIMAELFGKKTGICRGQGGSMHMFSSEWGLVRS